MLEYVLICVFWSERLYRLLNNNHTCVKMILHYQTTEPVKLLECVFVRVCVCSVCECVCLFSLCAFHQTSPHSSTSSLHRSHKETDIPLSSDAPVEEDEFHKCWISVVQGNHPCTQEDAVKLAAHQYQCYCLDRTAVNSVVGFSRWECKWVQVRVQVGVANVGCNQGIGGRKR